MPQRYYKQGDKTKNGMGRVVDVSEDMVLVKLSTLHYSKYVVWRYDSDGNTFAGHYFRDGEKASRFFTERVAGKVMG